MVRATWTTHRRLILVAVLLAVSLFGDGLLYAVLPNRPGEFNVTVWQVGILLSANRMVRLLTNELAGRVRSAITQRRHADRNLVIASLLGGVITIGYALPWGFVWLLALRVLWGACWSVLSIGGSMTVIEESTLHNRGTVVGSFHGMIRGVGGGVVLLGGVLVDLVGHAGTFLMLGAFGLVMTGLSGARLIWSRAEHSSSNSSREQFDSTASGDGRSALETPDAGVSSDSFRADTQNVGAAPRELTFGVWLIIASIMISGEGIATLTGAIVADHIAPEASLTPASATITGVLLSVWKFGELPLGLIMGWFGDRFGRILTAGIVIAFQILVVVAMVSVDDWRLLTATLTLFLISAGGLRLTAMAMAADYVAVWGGDVAMGRVSTVSDISRAVGPLAYFTIYSRIGVPGIGIVTVLVLSLCLAVFARQSIGARISLSELSKR